MADYNSSLPVRSEADLDGRVLVKVVDATNPDTQKLKIDTDGNAHVEASGRDANGVSRALKTLASGASVVALHDENGAAYSPTNPLAVSFEESKGEEVHDFKADASIAAGASATHDYTVPAGKTLKITQILASASGKMKIELKIDADGAGVGTFVTKLVQFSSAADLNMNVTLREPLHVPAGGVVQIAKSNRDAAGQDLYTTLVGKLF